MTASSIGRRTGVQVALVVGLLVAGLWACAGSRSSGPPRASGYVEASEVRVAPEVGGRVVALQVAEGDRIAEGAVVARLDASDVELTRRRVQAEREQAVAQLKLLQAGARVEDIRQARAQAEA